LRAQEPILDLQLFWNRTFLNANVLGYVAVLAVVGAEVLMPVYLQVLRGGRRWRPKSSCCRSQSPPAS
jgi:hypothetical protein